MIGARARQALASLLGFALAESVLAAGAPVLEQLPGQAGCVSDSGTGGMCADGTALAAAAWVAVSPDGRNAYAVSTTSDSVVVFDRDPTTGALLQKTSTAGCVSEDGSGGACANGVALDEPNAVVVSPDGRNVYVTTGFTTHGAIAVFDRDPATGQLSQHAGTGACVSDSGNGGACADGRALLFASEAVLSADGRHVYVAAVYGNGVAVFDRDPATGALTQKAGAAGCLSESSPDGCAAGIAMQGSRRLVLSPDQRHLYVAAQSKSAIAVIDRNPVNGELTQKAAPNGCVGETDEGGSCIDGHSLVSVSGVAVSPNGRNLYAASSDSDAVVMFDRDPATGILFQEPGIDGCISEGGTGGCASGTALIDAFVITATPDGASVYVGSAAVSSVAVFDRDLVDGDLTQKTGTAACISNTGGGCAQGTALSLPFGITTSPDGRSVYVASLSSSAVAAFSRRPAVYDVDGDGASEALTDALLLLRYDFGFRGAVLIAGAVDLANCTRCTAPLIEAFIQNLLQ